MMTVEVLTDRPLAQGQELADRLLTDLLSTEDAPESVLVGAREFVHVLVHEPAGWATGGAEGPARYLVRVTVPGSWNTKEFGAFVIPKITAIVASYEDDPTRLHREPHCVVQITGIREHSIGTLGHPTTSTEITRLLTENYRRSGEQVTAPAGSVVDPVCGMVVELETASFTLAHEGTMYAFCAPSCRRVFAEEHAIAV
jgi:YHS domain-containing protein